LKLLKKKTSLFSYTFAMFSIARHDDSENDERSYEKRLDRLSKLNERVSKKRKQTGADQVDDDDDQHLPQEEVATVEVDQLVEEITVDNDTVPDLESALVEESEPKKAKRNKPKKKKVKQDEPAQLEPTEEMEVVEEELAVQDELIPQTLDESVEEAETLEEGAAEEESMLQAFPDFTPTEPDVKDVAQLKSMGIPYWLAHPTIIEQGQTTPLQEMKGLSKNLLERCRDQGIDEFFAGALG
jgi:hypothetical protein